ncbi:DUF4270 domain-containing protein [Flavobacterium sp.]|uniref:DUF4270 domain-containing protein n=1 Tax=Flavobacterium sp. TaxID=239 RepID=UPI002CAA051E|nr:DUF4270 domain-containing protein [Flavobacterium sp.]HSD06649.1 DUF4270 domain-containing protein [Flavobacterium sp.]
MLRNSIFKTIPFLFFIVLFASCDKEFNVVGEDIIGDNSFDIKKDEFSVVAYNQKLGPIQSNNLPINPLGIYNNPSFGTTKANFVTQVALVSVNPTIDVSAKIKSAVLTIPYFIDSKQTVLDASTGKSTYVLDSIYGPSLAKMKLSLYESGYYMRNLDPEDQFTQPQKYYTNQYSEFASVRKDVLLNDSSNPAENEQFFFSPAEYEETKTPSGSTTPVTTRTAPAMRLNLNNAFFQSKILNAPAGSLANNDVFKDYFRGLFFNIESIGATEGNLAMINFAKGKITITYEETISTVVTEKTLVLSLVGNTADDIKGNTVSLLDQSNTNPDYANATNPSNIDPVNGDPNLYLKGGEGSLSILKLFGDDKFGSDGMTGAPNGVADQLDIMRSNKYLINEADLIFHLNSDAMGNSYVPQRIYLYDFKNNHTLYDYTYDASKASNGKNNRYVFGGIAVKESAANGGGYTYKFRITDHVRNLVKHADSTNVDLGLVVTESIDYSAFNSLRDKTGFPLKAPMASVMNPLGAIVYGNNVADEKKRLKFVIYYTKAN